MNYLSYFILDEYWPSHQDCIFLTEKGVCVDDDNNVIDDPRARITQLISHDIYLIIKDGVKCIYFDGDIFHFPNIAQVTTLLNRYEGDQYIYILDTSGKIHRTIEKIDGKYIHRYIELQLPIKESIKKIIGLPHTSLLILTDKIRIIGECKKILTDYTICYEGVRLICDNVKDVEIIDDDIYYRLKNDVIVVQHHSSDDDRRYSYAITGKPMIIQRDWYNFDAVKIINLFVSLYEWSDLFNIDTLIKRYQTSNIERFIRIMNLSENVKYNFHELLITDICNGKL